jgi:hypothetical protein
MTYEAISDEEAEAEMRAAAKDGATERTTE